MHLSWKQLVASVCGAVGAAVVLSYFGVAGTIVGVAVGSAAATIGSALAFKSIDTGHQKVQEIVSRPLPSDRGQRPIVRSEHAVSDPAVRPASPLAPSTRTSSQQKARRWSYVSAIALVFAISLAAVTIIEFALGESLSNAIGQSSDHATTSLGGLFISSGTTTTTTTTTTTRPVVRPTTTTSSTTTSTTTTTTTLPTATTTTTSLVAP